MAAERRSVLCVGLDPRPDLFPDEVFRGVPRRPRRSRAGDGAVLHGHRRRRGRARGGRQAAARVLRAGGSQRSRGGRAHRATTHASAAPGDRRRQARGIGSTAEAYAPAYLAPRRSSPPLADALTVNPYLGAGLAGAVRGTPAGPPAGSAFVLVRTSNPGGAATSRSWSSRTDRASGTCGAHRRSFAPVAGAVMGATQPGAVARARELMPEATFLLPGVGAQGGEVAALAPAFAPGPAGGLVSASRSVLYASRDNGRWQGEAARRG